MALVLRSGACLAADLDARDGLRWQRGAVHSGALFQLGYFHLNRCTAGSQGGCRSPTCRRLGCCCATGTDLQIRQRPARHVPLLCLTHPTRCCLCHPQQGLPYSINGVGDLLALFRCISCRFAFGTDVARPTSLGAPGRVYTSSEVGLALCLRHCAVFRAVQASKPLPRARVHQLGGGNQFVSGLFVDGDGWISRR